MSMDIASLGVKIDSREIKTGEKALDDFAAAGEKAEASASKLSTATGVLSRLYRDLAAAAAAWKIIEHIKDAALLAARYETMGVVMRVAGNNAGYTNAQMLALQATLEKTGISMLKSRETLTSLATANIDLSKAAGLARNAQDLAVVANINSSDAFARLVQGIKSGETEVLRTMGLNVSFENSYKKMAAQLGINAAALTEHQKIQARTNAVMQEATKYAGIYEESMSTAGKQLLSLQRYTEDLKVKQGEVFNEILTVAVMAYTAHLKDANGEVSALSRNGQLKEWGETITNVFAAVADNVNNALLAVKLMASGVAAGVQMGSAVTGYLSKTAGSFSITDRLAAWDEMKTALAANVQTFSDTEKDILSGQDKFGKALAERRAAIAADQAKGTAAADAVEAARIAKGEADRKAADAEAARMRAAEAAAKVRKHMLEEYQSVIKAIDEKTAAEKLDLVTSGSLTEGQKLAVKIMDDLRTGVLQVTQAEAARLAGKLEEYLATERANNAQKESEKLDAATLAATQAQITSTFDLVQKAKDEIEMYGMLPAAITRVTLARLQAKQAALEANQGTAEEIALVQGLIAANEQLAALQTTKHNMDLALDPAAAESFGSALKDAFKGASDGMVALSSALGDYADKQTAFEKRRKQAQLQYKGDSISMGRALTKISDEQFKSQIDAFADVAGAAKKFFNEQSIGYKIMDGLEKEFHLMQIAMQAERLYTSLFVSSASAAGVVAGQAVETTAVVEGQAVQNTAKIPGVFMSFMSAMGPWGAAAAAIAIAAVLGGAMGGGGPKVDVAKERQAAQGAGTVLGDASAKSESIDKAFDILSANSNIMLRYTSGMLSALQTIRDSIGGMATMIVQTVGLRGGAQDTKGLGLGSSQGFIGIGATSTTLQDQGIKFDPTTVAGVRASGVGAQGYSDVQHKNSGLWGLFSSTSNDRTMAALPEDLKKQFQLTVLAIADGVEGAVTALGQAGPELKSVIDNANVDLGELSLKGLSGKDVEDALKAQFGKFGDQLAAQVMPGITAFQKVGEGAFETLIRVASGVDNAAMELNKFGITAVAFTDVLRKQGDIGAEIFKQSVVGKETGGGATSGVGQIINSFTGALSDMSALYSQLVDVRRVLVSFGAVLQDVTIDMIRGAGGLDQLQSGISDYYDNFFSDAEKAAAGTAAMAAKFAALGVAMPTTIEGFRALVEGLPMATEAGQMLYGQLVALSGAFYDANTAAADATAVAAQQAADAAQAILDAQAQAFEDLLSESGFSVQGLAAVIRDGLLGTLNEADLGAKMTEMVVGGVYNALASGTANQIAQSVSDTIVAPLLHAILDPSVTAATLAATVSDASIDAMIASATAAVDKLALVFNDPGFIEVMAKLKTTMSGLAGVVSDGAVKHAKAHEKTAKAATKVTSASDKLNASLSNLSKDGFRTLVDYTRYVQLAKNAAASQDYQTPLGGRAVTMTRSTSVRSTGDGGTINSVRHSSQRRDESLTAELQALRAEVRQMKEEARVHALAVVKNTGSTARTLQKFDNDGNPETRDITVGV